MFPQALISFHCAIPLIQCCLALASTLRCSSDSRCDVVLDSWGICWFLAICLNFSWYSWVVASAFRITNHSLVVTRFLATKPSEEFWREEFLIYLTTKCQPPTPPKTSHLRTTLVAMTMACDVMLRKRLQQTYP